MPSPFSGREDFSEQMGCGPRAPWLRDSRKTWGAAGARPRTRPCPGAVSPAPRTCREHPDSHRGRPPTSRCGKPDVAPVFSDTFFRMTLDSVSCWCLPPRLLSRTHFLVPSLLFQSARLLTAQAPAPGTGGARSAAATAVTRWRTGNHGHLLAATSQNPNVVSNPRAPASPCPEDTDRPTETPARYVYVLSPLLAL